MNNLDQQYLDILKDIMENGVTKGDRTGTGTKSVFSREIRHKMSEGFPLLTTKKMAWKTMVTELLWFLRGDTNTQYLVQNNCNIWVGDTFKRYCKFTSANSSEWNEWMRDNGDGTLSMYTEKEFIEKLKTDDKFAERWGDIGPGYGKQWRKWDTVSYEGEVMVKSQIDQIQVLINTLKTNPDSRRLMVSAWNVSDVPKTLLPPCHYAFECWTRELDIYERLDIASKKYPDTFDIFDFGIPFHCTHEEIDEYYPVPRREISLRWVQRSCDFPLGVPFNIASYGLLLLLIADEVNMVPGDLIGLFGDSHIYLNQIEGVKTQLSRIPIPDLPVVKVKNGILAELDDIELIGYESHSKINFPLSN